MNPTGHSAMQYTRGEILAFLREVSIMSAAITGERGPIATVLLFAVDDDFTFYFATRRGSHKAIALTRDPRVGIAVWRHGKMLIQADGDASEISDEQEVDAVLDKLAESVGRVGDFWPPVLRLTESGGYVVYRMKLSWLRALDLTNVTIHAAEPPFTEFNFRDTV